MVQNDNASAFSVDFIPSDYHKRILHEWSVHRSPSTQKYVATIALPNTSREKHTQFLFEGDREARKFCQAFSPPKLQTSSQCMVCAGPAGYHRTHACFNCGAHICGPCSRRWSLNMVPKTYVQLENQLSTYIRICKSCDWLSNAFCMSLLQGRKKDAIVLFETGNLNLRSSFAGIRGEAMYPIHCAVLGGSIDLVCWLVESQMCNVTSKSKKSVQTSKNRTLIDLAMTGSNPLAMLQYLVGKCGLSIHDVKDGSLAPKTLELLVKTFDTCPTPSPSAAVISPVDTEEDSMVDPNMCTLCCERSCGDSVLSPCGHMVCCAECGANLQHCPVCKVECHVMRIFRL